MNKKDALKLNQLLEKLISIDLELNSIYEAEDEKFERLSEGLRDAPIGIKIDEIRTGLGDALQSLSEVTEIISDILKSEENTSK